MNNRYLKNPNIGFVLVLIFSVLGHIVSRAEKIDDTHYRFPYYANFEIVDENASQYDGKNGYELIVNESEEWRFSSNAGCFDQPLGSGGYAVNVFYRGIIPVDGAPLVHNFKYKKNGHTYSGSTTIYIDVVSPTGLYITNEIPATVVKNDNIYVDLEVEGIDNLPSYPTYPATQSYTLPDLIIECSSSNPSVISFSGQSNIGKGTFIFEDALTVRARATSEGKATIKASLYYGTSSSVKYMVAEVSREINVVSKVSPESISLSASTLDLGIGENETLVATVNPDKASQTVTWKTSNSNIATVSANGIVMGVAKGEATITATTENGLTANCIVTVSNCFTEDEIRYDYIYSANKNYGVKVVGKSKDKYSGSIVIPQTVEHLGKEYSVKRVGENAFKDCVGLKNIVLPQLEMICESAFSGCTNLSSVRLNVGVLKESAFSGCTNLASVQISNLKTTNESAFDNCYKLKKVYIDNIQDWCDLTINNHASGNPLWSGFGELYLNGEKLVDLTVSDVKRIKFATFICCSSLETVNIGEGVESIMGRVFQNCMNLQTVTLPSTLKSVEGYSFGYCPKIQTVNSYATNPPNMKTGWGDLSFNDYFAFIDSNPENIVLHVPIGCGDKYSTAPGWNLFGIIISDLDPVGINLIEIDEADPDIEIYNLNGIKLNNSLENLSPGIYIKKIGSQIEKIYIR